MDKQIIAIVVVVAVILTAGASLSLTQSSDGEDFQVISRVNTGGSGIYMKSDVLKERLPRKDVDSVLKERDVDSVLNKKVLGGLVMGTPGDSSIQHMQLQQIAEKSGLDFKKYNDGERLDDNTLYYIPDLNNFNKIKNEETINGGIIWEPQYQRVVQELSEYRGIALTNNLFEDHACCVVVANREWLNDNRDTAVRFLKAYIEGVKFVNDEDEESKREVVDVMAGKLKEIDREILEKAVKNVEYKFDDEKGDLSKLRKDIEKFSSELCDAGHISDDKLSSIKYKKVFVNDLFIREALEKDENEADAKANIVEVLVAVIDGDIHHMAAYVSDEKGYFEDHGLNVKFIGCSSGADVATMLLSGDAKIGFLGVSPAIIRLTGNV